MTWTDSKTSMCPECSLALQQLSEDTENLSDGKALARVSLLCISCDNFFEHKKICLSKEKAISYEHWAVKHIALCPDCCKMICIPAQEKEGSDLLRSIHAPKLEGSPKQIKWAEDIRRRYAMQFAEQKPESEFWDSFCNITEAKWWIETKGYVPLPLMARKIVSYEKWRS